jgi:hypothetical protein
MEIRVGLEEAIRVGDTQCLGDAMRHHEGHRPREAFLPRIVVKNERSMEGMYQHMHQIDDHRVLAVINGEQYLVRGGVKNASCHRIAVADLFIVIDHPDGTGLGWFAVNALDQGYGGVDNLAQEGFLCCVPAFKRERQRTIAVAGARGLYDFAVLAQYNQRIDGDLGIFGQHTALFPPPHLLCHQPHLFSLHRHRFL